MFLSFLFNTKPNFYLIFVTPNGVYITYYNTIRCESQPHQTEL
nr:MAG TPA: hypothetical protein [Inoviridae sp.]